MAERTHTFCRTDLEDGSMSASYTYDDASGRVLRVTIVNDHPTKTVEAGVRRDSGGWERSGSWGPNSGTTVIDIPPGQQPTLDLVPDGRSPGGGEPDYYPTVAGLSYWMQVTDG